MDPAMYPPSADAGAFVVADIFAAMRARENLWQALHIISLETGHIPLKKNVSDYALQWFPIFCF